MAFKTPVDLANNIVEPSLRERWNKYLKYGQRGSAIDKWNQEIQDIETLLPFKDQEEHDVWSNWGSDYRGSQDLLDLTNAIISRQEPNYQSDKADEIIKQIYATQRMPGNEYKAWARKRGI